jgi:Ca2+-binding RTX toxin-like protein
VALNDFDPDGSVDFSSVEIKQPPSHGILRPELPAPPGFVTYLPEPGYAGPDSFTYTIRDNDLTVSNEALVQIDVQPLPPLPPPPPNQPPVAGDDSAVVLINQSTEIRIFDNDIDPENGLDYSTLVIHQSPSHGSVTPNPFLPGATYVPDADYFGPDSFSYTVRDSFGAETNVATVSVQVTAALLVDGQLQIVGTSRGDDLSVQQKGTTILVQAQFGSPTGKGGAGKPLQFDFPAGKVQRISVSPGRGDDRLTMARAITQPTNVLDVGGDDRLQTGSGDDLIFDLFGDNHIDAGDGNDLVWTGFGIDQIDGGAGNDLIRAGTGDDLVAGGLGDDILLGMDGNDSLIGGAGMDVLIGGEGADQLEGDHDDDLLIAGTTGYDLEDFALTAIRAEWTSGLDYKLRVAHLAAGINDGIHLSGDGPLPTVFEDGDVDRLTGGDGRDWIFANLEADNGGPLDKVAGKIGLEIWLDADLRPLGG